MMRICLWEIGVCLKKLCLAGALRNFWAEVMVVRERGSVLLNRSILQRFRNASCTTKPHDLLVLRFYVSWE